MEFTEASVYNQTPSLQEPLREPFTNITNLEAKDDTGMRASMNHRRRNINLKQAEKNIKIGIQRTLETVQQEDLWN